MRLNEQRRYFEGEVFQSTHPRGVRHVNNVVQAVVAEFQSTHPRGVRRGYVILGYKPEKFQSTHPRGVRRSPRQPQFCLLQLFQSTHPRGVRLDG